MPRHLAGSKFTSRHTTVIDPAEDLFRDIAKLVLVTKIVLGPIESVRSRSPRLKHKTVPAGLFVTVYSLIAMQTFYIYTSEPAVVAAKLEELWGA
ncbi:hypothetical protein KBC55_01815 [Patescibacteria group bacterium]|nr:hypothetical protein [Patescibacteria group bacterium]